MSELATRRRTVGRIVVAILFALLAINAGIEVASTLRDPDGLVAMVAFQSIVGLSAAATAIGAWRGARWAPFVAATYGVVAAAMIVALGPLLDMPMEERNGLLIGAAVVLVVSLGCAWYLRRAGRAA